MGVPAEKNREIPRYLRERIRRKLRAEQITLDVLCQESGFEMTWMSRSLRGYRPMTEEQYGLIHGAIDRILQRRRESR